MSLITDGFSDYPKRWNDGVRLLLHDRLLAATILRLFPSAVKPNHLTLVRLILTVPTVVLIAGRQYAWGAAVFFLAALTDALDGAMARTRHQVSEWGIVWDPMADKILIGAVVAVIAGHLINPYLGLLLIAIEFFIIICGWRRRRSRGLVEPANFWGKTKMVFEVIGVSLLLVAACFKIDLLVEVSVKTLVLALIFALISVFSRLE